MYELTKRKYKGYFKQGHNTQKKQSQYENISRKDMCQVLEKTWG